MVNMHERRMSILRRVESGELGLEDGNRLLLELEERAQDGVGDAVKAAAAPLTQTVTVSANLTVPPATQLADEPAALAAQNPVSAAPAGPVVPQPQPVQTGQVVAEEKQASPAGWRPLWILPFLLGLFLTMISVNWMYLGWAAAGLGWGFWLSFFPLALGIGLMWMGWELRAARWLHLRIRQASGEHPRVIAFSLPLPIGLTRWAVQRFGKYSPQINGQDVGAFLDEFDQAIATDGPMHVYVDNQDGEQVEIWIEGPKR